MADAAGRGIVGRGIARLLQWRAVRAYLRYSEHRGPMLADSITYRALFSVFAAVLLGFSAAAIWLGGDPEAMAALTAALDRAVPGLSEVVDLSRIDAPVGFSIVGVVSFIGLAGAAISAIGSLRTALRILADELHDDVFFVWVALRNLLVAAVLGGLLVAAAVLSVAGASGIAAVLGWIGEDDGPVASWLGRGFGVLVVFVIDVLAVALVFRVLSGVRAPARALWGGALIGGAGLTVLQELSGLFVRGASANPLLASFAALIALLIWFNLSAQVILVASSYIVTATAESRDRIRERYGAETLAQHRRRRAEDAVRAASRELRDARSAEERERDAARGEPG
ncbi:YihY/virulence factor BrkB family protein [Leucobacter allii]|uniref:YihY/virulence factor BrkB family protein n=1 Tax=Leucobacter allii TaxID=2932247 RepID=A0ABY4FPT8_9MICO|nr:YihY/virulence factor BrkB family protein [Leucobacter allii]UOQ58301.1 YihY/virulence factor BrkB family protein [Leucobacter allii]UOR02880.1 YihY/virulence factor BrkB family protein [Leucobacter allii]